MLAFLAHSYTIPRSRRNLITPKKGYPKAKRKELRGEEREVMRRGEKGGWQCESEDLTAARSAGPCTQLIEY